MIGTAGVVAVGDGPAYADAVLELMSRPEAVRRRAAREQAERFPWAAAVDGFLEVHAARFLPVASRGN